MRKTESCLNCGEEREIAAHGLCFRCYRKKERAGERQLVDRHGPAIRREHKDLLRGFQSLMVGLSDLRVAASDVAKIRQLVDPYLVPIAKFLSAQPSENEGAGER
jgi:hypothetical protein